MTKIGTAVAQQNLKGILSYCNSPQMNVMEAYIQFTPGLIADDGEVTDGATEQFLRDYMSEFEQFITRVLTVLPRTTVPSSIDDSQMETASKASA